MNTITNYELRITEPLDFLFITSYFLFGILNKWGAEQTSLLG